MRDLPVILLAVFLSAVLVGCGPSKHRPIDVYLTVESEHGSPNPPVGSNYLNYGMTITTSVDSSVPAGEGTRYACAGWTGTGSAPATGEENLCQFTITQNSSIVWLWKTQYYLTTDSLYGDPQGEGWYDEGATASWSVTSPWPGATGVQYVATPPTSGTVVMDAPKTVTVTWTTQYKLTTTVSPEGSGTVELSPAGEDGYYYDEGAVVTLTANPETGYIFGYWSGDLSGGNNRETLNMNEPKSVTANFALLAIYVDGASGQDTNDGLTWETAVKTVQKGLDLAPATGWTVLVANGTYTGTDNKNLDFKGKAILLQSAGGAENCIIDCQISGRGFYFHSGETEATIVEGLTIRNGRVFGDWPDSCGGGITCLYGSSPTITNCTLSENSARDDGGAVCCYQSSPTITNCTLSKNSADYSGGAVCCFSSSPTITNCALSGNWAIYGGAVYCSSSSSSPTISNCTFSENSAHSGGAVYCYSHSSPTITNCTLSGNSAAYYGGAIYCDYSSPTISNCTFSENSASGNYGCGGAVYCDYLSSPTITNCTFSGNSADYGGAVSCYASSPTITNCTFSGNSSAQGGAVYCLVSSPTITNSILWSNFGSLGKEIYIYDSSSSVTLNKSDVTPDGYGGEIGNITENNCIHSDPLFVDAANGDYHLLDGSPCRDAGDNSLVPPEVTTDLDGNPRIQNGTVDMGAYEYQP